MSKLLKGMTHRQLHEHIADALSGVSGVVLKEFLRSQCFMQPGPRVEPWEGEERVAFRYGRMTLFQLLEFYQDPDNFPKDTPRQA